METIENKKHMFSSEIYERAKSAKEAAQAFIAELKSDPDIGLKNLEDFSALEKIVGEQSDDIRIVIGLGRLNWNKGVWDFDTPSTYSVMNRMKNLEDRNTNNIRDYLELHIKYEALAMENQNGFRRHSVNHNIYQGSYAFNEEAENVTRTDWEKDDSFPNE